MPRAEVGPPRTWNELPPTLNRQECEERCRGIALPVAVTGATGLVGSHVVDALVAGGIRPRVLVRDPARLEPSIRGEAEIVRGDLASAEMMAYLVGGCRTVIHCAGLVRAPSEERFEAVNWFGTRSVVAALEAKSRDARLVHVSSLAALGPSADIRGKRPEDTPMPISAYGRSKLAGELVVKAYLEPWVILRPPAIYGPRDSDLYQVFRLATQGRVPLPVGDRFVTIAFVADVVRAILAAAAGRGTGQVLHVGEPRQYSVEVLVRLLAEVGEVPVKVMHVPGALVRLAGLVGNILQFLGSETVALTSDKARELLARHWTARLDESLDALGLDGCVPFATGVAATWAWYRDEGWLPHAKIPGD